MQLYTSKSYENLRSTLVNPDDDDDKEIDPTNYNTNNWLKDNKNVQKHVLSPQLVNAISRSAQILWAHGNAQQAETGLLGRSDVRLQTAVGLPVAVDDATGNMCVVVMFSPKHVPNSEAAIEYLQFISQSATSSSIPCLLPCAPNMRSPPLLTSSSHNSYNTTTNVSGDGVTATLTNGGDPTTALTTTNNNMTSKVEDTVSFSIIRFFFLISASLAYFQLH